jgi:hypothetical protein
MSDSSRIDREKRTIRAMIAIYCRAHHATAGRCAQCEELLNYAVCRLDRCPFGANKTTCTRCPIHCYKPAMREKIRTVMRYAGPRMLYQHPVLALWHLFDSRRTRKADD